MLIIMWLFGDLYKLSYYYTYKSPLPLILCTVFQICTDCLILNQFTLYCKKNDQKKGKILLNPRSGEVKVSKDFGQGVQKEMKAIYINEYYVDEQ